jgi:hypothetical protein
LVDSPTAMLALPGAVRKYRTWCRQAVAERVQRRGRTVDVAAARRRLAVVEDRQLADAARDRHRQLAARVGAAEQQVGHGEAGLLAHVPAFDQRVGFFRQQVDGQRTAVQQQHHGRLAEREDGARQVVLLAQQVQAVRSPRWLSAQASRAGLLVVAQDHDDGVGRLGRFHRLGDQAR